MQGLLLIEVVAGAKGQRYWGQRPHCPISACYLTDSGDLKSQRTHQAQVASRCVCAPGSYTRDPFCGPQRAPPDPHFSPAELEWVTKEKGATLLYALLVRVE